MENCLKLLKHFSLPNFISGKVTSKADKAKRIKGIERVCQGREDLSAAAIDYWPTRQDCNWRQGDEQHVRTATGGEVTSNTSGLQQAAR